jgi:CYTH domain-containing protein
MSTSRRFLLASSLARLIQTERGGQRIVEGYFPERDGRCSCVRLDGRTGSLILITHRSNGPAEEPAEIPLAHAEVLLAVATGEVDYVHTSLFLGADAHVSRFTVPGPLDLIDVTFEHEQEAREFQPPAWFGPEVGADPRFRNQSLALDGLAPAPELPLTDEALNTLLDTLENRRAPRHRTWLKERATS